MINEREEFIYKDVGAKNLYKQAWREQMKMKGMMADLDVKSHNL